MTKGIRSHTCWIVGGGARGPNYLQVLVSYLLSAISIIDFNTWELERLHPNLGLIANQWLHILQAGSKQSGLWEDSSDYSVVNVERRKGERKKKRKKGRRDTREEHCITAAILLLKRKYNSIFWFNPELHVEKNPLHEKQWNRDKYSMNGGNE